MQLLKVKYLGKAYFTLIKKSRKLKTMFVLGERITIVVGQNRALVITPDGQDEVSSSQLSKFLP